MSTRCQALAASLWAPRSYWEASEEEIDATVNGAGPRGYGWAVPDRIWGLSITPAADIHDWMYAHGANGADKDLADRAFLQNMIRLITEDKGWLSGTALVRWLRRRRALDYYIAVRDFGGSAFWAGKPRREI